jgi:catalase
VATNLNGGQMSYRRDLAPGQNPHVNYEPSIHQGLHESAREEPNNSPELRGRLTRSVIERRNDYIHARGRYCTMMDWERDDLVLNMGTLLGQCERDVQERMIWHLFMVHDDYGSRVGQMIGITADDVRHLSPLPKQVLTDDERRRLQNLGKNGDKIDETVWGQWTSSVKNYKASAEEVLGGMRNVPTTPAARQAAE